MMNPQLNLTKEKNYSVLSFNQIKNIDAGSALRLKAEIKGLLDESILNLIIDLQGIQFIDSTGFGALISVLKTIRSRNGRLILCNASVEVVELMDLMQLLNVFERSPDLQTAQLQFQG